LHFDAENSILVVHYLADHRDLADFYIKESVFPPAIAASLGAMLAVFHRTTLERQDYRDVFQKKSDETITNQPANLAKGLQRIGPEIFGQAPDDGIKFYALYQRYDSLGIAIAELCESFYPCCLTHNDLKLNNILLPINWEELIADSSLVDPRLLEESGGDRFVPLKLIDWERSTWGDPAFDLGMLIASYLSNWLGSLAVSKSIPIEEALRLAMTPLEVVQPSIAALGMAYFGHFPEILQQRPDFLQRVVQFSGFCLIQTILSMLQYQKTFGNTGICMLQVAKTLLCRPEQSVPTVFGMEAAELTRLSPSPVGVSGP
ncbi:MAG: aminoglycoside phosphotransferase family protein, partial [Kovacikia sp.]